MWVDFATDLDADEFLRQRSVSVGRAFPHVGAAAEDGLLGQACWHPAARFESSSWRENITDTRRSRRHSFVMSHGCYPLTTFPERRPEFAGCLSIIIFSRKRVRPHNIPDWRVVVGISSRLFQALAGYLRALNPPAVRTRKTDQKRGISRQIGGRSGDNLLLSSNNEEMTMPHAIRIHRTGGPEVLQWEAVDAVAGARRGSRPARRSRP